jgi:CBS domain containing-hemolysin-like protein
LAWAGALMASAGLPDAQLLITAAGLVVLAGFVAMTESALSVVSAARAGEMAKEGARGAKALQAVAADVVRHLNLLLLLRLACELTATVLVAMVSVDTFGVGWGSALLAAGAMTLVSFVVVGVAPRTIGRQHAYTVGRYAAPIVRWLGRVLGPLTRLLILIGNAVTPGKGFREGPFNSQVELKELVDLAERRGVVEHGERQMIHSALTLGDTIAREVMVPRTEMVWVEDDKTCREALTLALSSGFSRIPVVGESIDDVLGIVYLKDVAKTLTGGYDDNTRVTRLMRPPVFIPESKPVDDLLTEMQKSRTHLAIVIDEYGGTAGLIAIEDILEEIVGEITDEYDVEENPIQHLEQGRVRVSARLPIEDLAEIFNVELPADEVETVAGLLAQALGRVPTPGATATVGGLRLTAEPGKQVDGPGRRNRNRIETVLVERPEEELADVRD